MKEKERDFVIYTISITNCSHICVEWGKWVWNFCT